MDLESVHKYKDSGGDLYIVAGNLTVKRATWRKGSEHCFFFLNCEETTGHFMDIKI